MYEMICIQFNESIISTVQSQNQLQRITIAA